MLTSQKRKRRERGKRERERKDKERGKERKSNNQTEKQTNRYTDRQAVKCSPLKRRSPSLLKDLMRLNADRFVAVESGTR